MGRHFVFAGIPQVSPDTARGYNTTVRWMDHNRKRGSLSEDEVTCLASEAKK